MAELGPMLAAPPRVPTELEIPTTVGGALSSGASVQLSSGVRRGVGPAPDSGQYSIGGSGSALRYHSDSKLKSPQPPAPTPPPARPAPAPPARVADPFAPPALSASVTHGAKAAPPSPMGGRNSPLRRPRPAAPRRP